jgi:aminoglycoside phosphotransferase (APT) family kinase protein
MKPSGVLGYCSTPAFDRPWLMDHLPRYLWPDDPDVQMVDLVIAHAWLSAKRTIVLYRLRLGHGTQIGEQLYTGYLLPDDGLAAAYACMQHRDVVQPPLGRAVACIPEANLILLAFPNDRNMSLFSTADLRSWFSQPRLLVNAAGLACQPDPLGHETTSTLREVQSSVRDETSHRLHNTRIEVLRYIPTKRCTARCEVTVHVQHEAPKDIRFIAKQFSDASKAKRLYRHLVALGQQQEVDGVRVPRVLALDEDRALVLLEELPGTDLKQALPTIEVQPVMQAVGELLARLHCLSLRVRKTISRQSELEEVQHAIHTISAAVPGLRHRLFACLDQLSALHWDDTVPSVLLHGSYRLNHIFIHDGALALVDLDSLRVGHPAYDVANFLTALSYAEAQEQLSTSLRRDIVRSFLHGYAAKQPYALPPIAVLWYVVSLLLNKQAYKYVTHLHRDRDEKVQQMLRQAEAALAVAQPAALTFEALWKI